ncbi:YitT family protein [Dysosmobacter sp. HCP28S3_G4]|uniref:YitT family protein n=1 Tax=Dysosmobacter sp. HCP28S3_G4 TaxID=3438938 RepID=UPI003F0C725B|nr:YitT family protein [Dysosmobacter sp.]
MKKVLKQYLIITIGSIIYAVAFDWFFAPNQVALGGITGLAQVINAVVPALSVGIMTIVMNVPLFLLGWKFIGWHLLTSSLFAMLLSSAAIDAIAAVHTFTSMDPMLAGLCGGALMGLGLGIVFSQGATTGGTDVVARLLKLKFPWLPIGNLVLIPDFVILSLAALVFGRVEAALYGLISLFVQAKVMDTVLYGMDTSKVAYIVTDRWKQVSDAILAMERGVTFLRGEGAFSGAEKHILMVAFKQKEIVQIKQLVHETDPRAFLIVVDARDVLGEGFGEYQKDEI